MCYIEPRPDGLRIVIDSYASPEKARRIAQQILDAIPESVRMPLAGKGWMKCRKCGRSVVGDDCYKVT